MANVVFLWHMHQPYYVNPQTRTAMMPWVRLHAVKGYLDMVSIIEEFPSIRVNFNLTPVLVLQIQELVDGQIRDLWLEWSRKPAAELSEDEKFSILENFFKIHWDNLIKPHPRYWELLNKRGLTFYAGDVRHSLRYWTTQEILDLQVWYNLSWCGYTANRLYPELDELRKKDRGFTEEEKQRVLDIHMEILRTVLQKYAAAEQRGQAELTTTPFFHPILPLVYDSTFAERSLPGRQFPNRYHWPQDAEAQLMLAVQQHEKVFGRKPRGLWPSEGSIAPELIPLMQRAGIDYFCSDEENLFNSLKRDPIYAGHSIDHLELFQGWRVRFEDATVNAVFREKPLSDFIGFMAAKNNARAAADHLLHHLKHISHHVPRDHGLIPLILDGENAWETFADGGEAFLRALYGGIASQSDWLHSCTIEEYFTHHSPHRELTTLHTGSWIGSNFDIWIGEADENEAWNLLGETRTYLEQQIHSGALREEQKERALREIYAAEGSDWFWWYGPDFHTECDELFDELFRQHLKNVYAICGDPPPAELDRPITGPLAGTPRFELPTQLVTPEIDGRASSFFEWIGSGHYIAGSEMGAMYRAERLLHEMYYGYDTQAFYLRLDLRKWVPLTLRLDFSSPRGVVARTSTLHLNGLQKYTLRLADGTEQVRESLAARDIIEWGISFFDLGLQAGDVFGFQVRLFRNNIEVECYPETCPLQLTVPDQEFALAAWVV